MKPVDIDPVFADSILLDICRDGDFSTNDPQKIEAVGYLCDCGYIEKQYKYDNEGRIIAVRVARMTNLGKDRVKQFYADYNALNPNGDRQQAAECQDERIRESDEEKRVKAAGSYDSMIRKIAFGGLGISLSVLSLVFITNAHTLRNMNVSVTWWMLMFCVVALLAWVGNIVILLWLERCVVDLTTKRKLDNESAKPIDVAAYNAEICKMEKWNVINGFLSVGGIVLFGVFVMTLLFRIFCAADSSIDAASSASIKLSLLSVMTTPASTLDWLTSVTAIFSAVAAILVAIFTFKNNKTQEKLAELQERLTKIDERNDMEKHSPCLRICRDAVKGRDSIEERRIFHNLRILNEGESIKRAASISIQTGLCLSVRSYNKDRPAHEYRYLFPDETASSIDHSSKGRLDFPDIYKTNNVRGLLLEAQGLSERQGSDAGQQNLFNRIMAYKSAHPFATTVDATTFDIVKISYIDKENQTREVLYLDEHEIEEEELQKMISESDALFSAYAQSRPNATFFVEDFIKHCVKTYDNNASMAVPSANIS